MNNNTTLQTLFQTANENRRGSEWSDLYLYPSVSGGVTPSTESDDDTGDPDELQQGELPSGPTHVAARRTPDQLASARKFIAAAGRVKFDRGRATLKAVWMSVAYYASLGAGPKRVCFAEVETLANRALVSERTVRTHLAALAGHGLIQTNYRGGGHAPTKWSIREVSPSVLGGKNCRAGRQRLPGRAATVAAEVSNRSSAPTERELQLASTQPDGACAPPAAEKKAAQKTKKEQPTQPADPRQALAPGKTDTGGATQGGATEKQIKFLQLLADRVGAEPAEDLWRAADRNRLQAQIKAAVPFKARGVDHTHASFVEVMFLAGIENKIGFKEGVQRCECGAVRVANINRAGEANEFFPWTLSGYLVDYLVEWTELHGPKTDQELARSWVRAGESAGDDPKGECIELLTGRWAAPMTFSDVRALCETAPKMSQEEAEKFCRVDMPSSAGDCAVDMPADGWE